MAVALESRIDFNALRAEFPALHIQRDGQPIVYLDNAATTQKPERVLAAVDKYWREQNANVHRGVHYLSQVATEEYEVAREKVRRFLNAGSSREIIFTKGCTDSINLVASSLSSNVSNTNTSAGSAPFLSEGDQIAVSEMEHHSNIVPWQIAAQRTGAVVRAIPITDLGDIDLDGLNAVLASGRVKLVAVAYANNAIGTINPLKQIAKLAHDAGALILADGAQSSAHLRPDVLDLDVDFYTLSGHKMLAPMGIGALYGREQLLKNLPAYQGGGEMIRTVSIEAGTTYADLPAKFEAGTPNVAGAIGLGAAIDYFESIGHSTGQKGEPLGVGMEAIAERERQLLNFGAKLLEDVPGLNIVGRPMQKVSILSFTVDGIHPHDLGTVLDAYGVAVRTGHHCCMPLMKRLGLPATARASISFYNNEDDLSRLAEAVVHAKETMGA